MRVLIKNMFWTSISIEKILHPCVFLYQRSGQNAWGVDETARRWVLKRQIWAFRAKLSPSKISIWPPKMRCAQKEQKIRGSIFLSSWKRNRISSVRAWNGSISAATLCSIWSPRTKGAQNLQLRFEDRVVHHAVCNVIDPIFERDLSLIAMLAKRKRVPLAVKRCQAFTRKFEYFLKCDIRKFFESVDHEILKSLFRRQFKDHGLRLLDIIIDHAVPGNETGQRAFPSATWPVSILRIFTWVSRSLLKGPLRVGGYVRYMDDFISFSNDKAGFIKCSRK